MSVVKTRVIRKLSGKTASLMKHAVDHYRIIHLTNGLFTFPAESMRNPMLHIPGHWLGDKTATQAGKEVPLFHSLSPQHRIELLGKYLKLVMCFQTKPIPFNYLNVSICYTLFQTLIGMVEDEIKHVTGSYDDFMATPAKERGEKDYMFTEEDAKLCSIYGEKAFKQMMSYHQVVKNTKRTYDGRLEGAEKDEQGFKIERVKMRDHEKILVKRTTKRKALKDLKRTYCEAKEQPPADQKEFTRKKILRILGDSYTDTSKDGEEYRATTRKEIFDALVELFGSRNVSSSFVHCTDIEKWKTVIWFIRRYFFFRHAAVEKLLIGKMDVEEDNEWTCARNDYLFKLIQIYSEKYEETYEKESIYLAWELVLTLLDNKFPNMEHCQNVLSGKAKEIRKKNNEKMMKDYLGARDYESYKKTEPLRRKEEADLNLYDLHGDCMKMRCKFFLELQKKLRYDYSCDRKLSAFESLIKEKGGKLPFLPLMFDAMKKEKGKEVDFSRTEFDLRKIKFLCLSQERFFRVYTNEPRGRYLFDIHPSQVRKARFWLKCGYCTTRLGKMSRCSRCDTEFYCSRECQQKDWPQHKSRCKKWRKIRKKKK